jgi:hypothetical protein
VKPIIAALVFSVSFTVQAGEETPLLKACGKKARRRSGNLISVGSFARKRNHACQAEDH